MGGPGGRGAVDPSSRTDRLIGRSIARRSVSLWPTSRCCVGNLFSCFVERRRYFLFLPSFFDSSLALSFFLSFFPSASFHVRQWRPTRPERPSCFIGLVWIGFHLVVFCYVDWVLPSFLCLFFRRRSFVVFTGFYLVFFGYPLLARNSTGFYRVFFAFP